MHHYVTMWLGFSEETGELYLVAFFEKDVQMFMGGSIIQLALWKWRLCLEVLGVLWVDEVGESCEGLGKEHWAVVA